MNQYQNNAKYIEYTKAYERNKYRQSAGIKQLKCKVCEKNKRRSTLDQMEYQYSLKKFICPDCLPENNVEQYKNSCGRPRKKIIDDEDKNKLIV